MSSVPRRSLRLRILNLPEEEREEVPVVTVKATPKRRAAINAESTTERDKGTTSKSPMKKKLKEDKEKEVKDDETIDKEEERNVKEEEEEAADTDEEMEKEEASTSTNKRRMNEKVVAKDEDKNTKNECLPVKRSQRRWSHAAAEAMKKSTNSSDDDFDIEKETKPVKDRRSIKKEKDLGNESSSISVKNKNVKNGVRKVFEQKKNGKVVKKKGVGGMEDDTESEYEEEEKKADEVNTRKKGTAIKTGSKSSKVVQRPPMDRTSEQVRLLMDRNYVVDRDEMISWEKRAVHMTRALRKLEQDRNNDTGRMKEVMDRVWEFVERCLKNRVYEMGDAESVRLCYVLQGEFDEWERKKKMTITQRIKEKVENEKKEREAEMSDEDEEEDEWEAMETVDGDGEMKTVQVHVENEDKSTHWKSKWLKQEVNRTMRTRCENIHKAHLLSYMSHLRHLAAMALSTTSKHGEIPLSALALSMLPSKLTTKQNEKNRWKERMNLIKWWSKEFNASDDGDEEEEKSGEERMSERMMNKRFRNDKEAALFFFSLSARAGFIVRLVCRCKVMTKKVPESPEAKKKAEKKEKENKKKGKDTLKDSSEECIKQRVVDYWIEIWDEANEAWTPIDIIRADSVKDAHEDEEEEEERLFMESLNAYMDKGGPVLYMLAIDNEFAIRDVSARYIHSNNFVSNEFRKRRAGQEWLNELFEMEPWRAHSVRSCKEDDEWLTSMKVELPKLVKYYKDHPLYVLDKDVLKMQRIFPYNVEPEGEVKGYKVYNRKFLRPTNTSKWYEKMGRQVREDEPPVGEKKLTNPLTGESVMQGLYGYWQTDPWNAGEVKNGRVPRNDFDNIYMYQPVEMCPKGGIYIIPEGIQRVALELGKDFVQAVIGWIYKNGNIVPLIRGAVFAKEDIPELVAAWKECERRWKEEERKIRCDRSLGRWKKLIKGMLRLAAMRKEFEPMENKKKKGTRMEDEAVREEEAAAWPQQRYGGDLFE